jgi:hypothetical protein
MREPSGEIVTEKKLWTRAAGCMGRVAWAAAPAEQAMTKAT